MLGGVSTKMMRLCCCALFFLFPFHFLESFTLVSLDDGCTNGAVSNYLRLLLTSSSAGFLLFSFHMSFFQTTFSYFGKVVQAAQNVQVHWILISLWFIARVKSMPHTAHSSHLINQKQRYTPPVCSLQLRLTILPRAPKSNAKAAPYNASEWLEQSFPLPLTHPLLPSSETSVRLLILGQIRSFWSATSPSSLRVPAWRIVSDVRFESTVLPSNHLLGCCTTFLRGCSLKIIYAKSRLTY